MDDYQISLHSIYRKLKQISGNYLTPGLPSYFYFSSLSSRDDSDYIISIYFSLRKILYFKKKYIKI